MMVFKGHSRAKCEYDISTLISNMKIRQIFHLRLNSAHQLCDIHRLFLSELKILFFIRKVIFFSHMKSKVTFAYRCVLEFENSGYFQFPL